MFFGDKDVWALYGLENPDAGVEETEAAEPSEQPEGENETEVAELSDDGESIEDQEEDVAADEVEDGAEPDDNTATKPEQSKAERAKQAAARRAREQEATITAAVQAALQKERAEQEAKWTDFFKRAGMRDPNRENQPITNLEEYNAYRANFDLKQAEQDLKRGKLTAETLQQVVAQMPQMQHVQQLQQQAEREKQEAQQQAQQQRVAAEIAEIGKLDPTITSLQDLMKAENGRKVYEYVKTGLNLVDAYKLANMDKLTERAAAAARAQRTSSEQSKHHLKSTTARGQGGVEVPSAQAALYRKLIPGITDAQMRESYREYLKDIK